MKRIFTLLVFAGFGLAAVAQQDPQFSQNMFNRLTINPAYAGSSDAICATLLARNQWVGFEGHPSTGLLALDAPVEFLRGGAGLSIAYDKLGFEKNLLLKLAYAYRFRFGSSNLGIGADVGFVQKSIDGTQWRTSSTTPDPAVPLGQQSKGRPDFSFGAYYNTNDLYFGLSTTHLAEGEIKLGNATTNLRRHYYMIAGYNYKLNETFTLMPSVLAKSDAASTQIDINTNVLYNDLLWGGVSYRVTDAVVAMVGLKLGNLKVGYSYDFTTSKIKNHSNGSHEVMLGFCFKTTTTKPLPLNRNVRFL